ncbi:MAG: HD domain-containing protein [Clostridiales bacterium]|nr:HD domain-containing protein [Clostridiales bacterium]
MTSDIVRAMIDYFGSDVKRVNHLLKVLAFAKTIAECEGIDRREREILEAAAAVHDIGIKISEEKYGSSSGYYQQKEGPGEARKLLLGISGLDGELIDRVCYLVSRHHKYSDIDGMDCQILIEADFIVNVFEDEISGDTIRDVYKKIFKTDTGRAILKSLYLKEEEE